MMTGTRRPGAGPMCERFGPHAHRRESVQKGRERARRRMGEDGGGGCPANRHPGSPRRTAKKETIDISEEDDEDDQWWPWNDTWWSRKADEEASPSANSKKTSSPPRRRRSAASSKDVAIVSPDPGPTMGMWRNLLGLPDYGESKMRALPEQQLAIVQQHALALSPPEITQLLASWGRFIALLLAEVNHCIMESQRKQAANRERWMLPEKKHDKGNDDEPGGHPEGGHGDASSLVQGHRPTPVFSQMRKLRQGLELLPPRRRGMRAFVLLQRLRASAHFRHGPSVIGAQLNAVARLLQETAQAPEEAVEDVDIAWCEAAWDELNEAFNHAMVQAAPQMEEGRKRPLEGNDVEMPATQRISMAVVDAAGMEVGSSAVQTGASTGPWRVRVEHVEPNATDAQETAAASMASTPMAASSSLDITVIPSVVQQLYELWERGLVSDIAVCARIGLSALDGFRERFQQENIEGENVLERCSSGNEESSG